MSARTRLCRTILAGLAVFGENIVSNPTPTPTQPGVAAVVPTLSFPMLALLGLALLGAAFFLMRKA
jgi:hypothetical protein